MLKIERISGSRVEVLSRLNENEEPAGNAHAKTHAASDRFAIVLICGSSRSTSGNGRTRVRADDCSLPAVGETVLIRTPLWRSTQATVENRAERLLRSHLWLSSVRSRTARDLHFGRHRPRYWRPMEDIMTKRFVSMLSTMAMLTVLSPLAVSIGAAEVTCQIPFAFTVNNTTLPAGRYTVSTHNNMLYFNTLTRAAYFLGTPTASAIRTTPKLMFDKSGDHYTLREVWLDGRSGREFPKSRSHEDRRAATTHGDVERVVIAAR
jgi:hypothetical protein